MNVLIGTERLISGHYESYGRAVGRSCQCGNSALGETHKEN